MYVNANFVIKQSKWIIIYHYNRNVVNCVILQNYNGANKQSCEKEKPKQME